MNRRNYEIERATPRVFTARPILSFDQADVTRRLYAAEECYGDFLIVNHLARPSAETSFDVCTDGTDLFVSVLLLDSGMAMPLQSPWPAGGGAGPNGVEALFCPEGDGIGFLQFGLAPGGELWTNHHWPYRDGRPNLAARPVWDASVTCESMGEDIAWIAFLRFPLSGIVGQGREGCLGFNVLRSQLRTDESSAASYCSGSGFSDASSCGWLRLPGIVSEPPAPAYCSLAPVPGVQLQATYDFPDEMVGGPYTPEALRHELRILREHGFGRIYWIDYPEWVDETARLLADPSAKPAPVADWRRFSKNHALTIEAFGGDPMPVCARIAHEEGLEFFTVMKPYDSMSVELPGCAFARNPAWSPPLREGPAGPVSLFADNAAELPFPISSVRVYTSLDNVTYEACSKARLTEDLVLRPRYEWTPAGKRVIPGEERVRAITIDGIDRAAYLAIEFPSAATPGSFGNQRYLLVECDDPLVTLSKRARSEDFQTTGFDFHASGAAAVWSDSSEGCELRQDFPAGSVLGVRFGYDTVRSEMRDPSFPQVRKFWLNNWVQRAIDAGADGVDVRIAFHASCDEWLAYAFAEPVLESFRNRTGREPVLRHEDYAIVRRIRGEFHTQFLREAKAMLAPLGKRLEVHVEARMKTPPEHDTYAQIHWDYATWIDEGIVDGVNLKYLGPFSPFVEEHILPRARRRGIPVHVIGAIGDPRTITRTPELTREMLSMAQSAGLKGLNLYELWVYMRTTSRGEPFLRGCSRAVLAELKRQSSDV